MADVLFVIMRWTHFASMATLIGGLLYGRFVMLPSIGALSPDSRDAIAARIATAYRPMIIAAVCGLVLSGLYNLFTNPGHTVKYHILLGVKLMLALHVFAMAFLITTPKNPRVSRMMTGTVISGLIVLAISAYLRRIF
jgi:uncharacterized membrane protein